MQSCLSQSKKSFPTDGKGFWALVELHNAAIKFKEVSYQPIPSDH